MHLYPLTKTKLHVFMVLAFCFSLCLSGLVIFYTEDSRIDWERQHASVQAAERSLVIEREVGRLFSMMNTLQILLRQKDGELDDFPLVSTRLMLMFPGTKIIQLAPGGIVSECYPLKGNEDMLGFDLSSDTSSKKEFETVKNFGKMMFFGPHFFKNQDDYYSTVRLPVFLPKTTGQSEEEEQFWGLINVMLRYDDIKSLFGLDNLADLGYSYELIRQDGLSRSSILIAESKIPLSDYPVKKDIFVEGTHWNLRLTPEMGWYDYRILALKIFLAIIFSFLLSESVRLVLTLKDSEKKLTKLALHDALTDIPNRANILASLKRIHMLAQKDKAFLAVCYFDVNLFKKINDIYGHDAGDIVLKEVATRVKNTLGKNDIFGRLGGDEFLLVLSSCSTKKEVEAYLQKLAKIIAEPIHLSENKAIFVTLSMGVSLYPELDSSPENMVQCADSAMYHAKRNRLKYVHFYSNLDKNIPLHPHALET